AVGAYADLLRCPADHGTDILEVHIPAPLGHIMGMADPVPKLRALAAHFTHFRHLEIAPVSFEQFNTKRIAPGLTPKGCSAIAIPTALPAEFFAKCGAAIRGGEPA